MILAVVQARMSSARFPGKVLHPVDGRPMLQYLLERLSRAASLQGVVVATSVEPEDDAIVRFCEQLGVRCFRGPLENVAARFRQLMEACPAAAYARVSGDSPLLDPGLVDRVARRYRDQEPDLATNIFPRTFPKGMSVEVFGAEAYRRAYPRFDCVEDLEHVTRHFYTHADRYRIANVANPEPCPDIDLSIDHPSQLTDFAGLLRLMDRPHWEYGWREVLDLRARVKSPLPNVHS